MVFLRFSVWGAYVNTHENCYTVMDMQRLKTSGKKSAQIYSYLKLITF